MTDRRLAAWARVLCALALGLGLSVATGAAPAQSLHATPAVAQVHHGLADAARGVTHAPTVVRHAVSRHVPTTLGAASLVAAVLAGGLLASSRNRKHSATGAGRRTSPAGARAPPVVIGI